MSSFRIFCIKYPHLVAISIILFSLFPRFHNLNNPLVELHGFRQTQTAYTVKMFIDDGLNFFNYKTPVLGRPYTIPFEFPILQLTAYYFYHTIGCTIDVACRMASIFYFVVAAYFLFLLAFKFLRDVNFAIIVLMVFCFLPFNIF